MPHIEILSRWNVLPTSIQKLILLYTTSNRNLNLRKCTYVRKLSRPFPLGAQEDSRTRSLFPFPSLSKFLLSHWALTRARFIFFLKMIIYMKLQIFSILWCDSVCQSTGVFLRTTSMWCNDQLTSVVDSETERGRSRLNCRFTIATRDREYRNCVLVEATSAVYLNVSKTPYSAEAGRRC